MPLHVIVIAPAFEDCPEQKFHCKPLPSLEAEGLFRCGCCLAMQEVDEERELVGTVRGVVGASCDVCGAGVGAVWQSLSNIVEMTVAAPKLALVEVRR